MAKMKEPKIARIRYQAGDPSKPNTIAEDEGFYFEAWVPSGEGMPYGWSTICFCPCHASADIESDEKNFIHYDIFKYMADWSRMGYEIHYGVHETAYLDQREKEEWAKYNEKKDKRKS